MSQEKEESSNQHVDKKPMVYLIDGSGYIFRAYYGIRRMNRSDGLATNAVYGFAKMLLKVIKERNPVLLGIAFDLPGKTFRHDLYEDYKGHRPELPEDMPHQFGLIRRLVEAFNIPILEKAGFEADDVLATCARIYREKGHHVRIITGDKDLMQLVNQEIHLIDDMKGKRDGNPEVGPEEVREKFGVPPKFVVDLLALAGDAADNVPGVKGIGPKTAAELILKYGDVEQILLNAPKIKQKMRRERLIEYAEMARLSKELVILAEDVDVGDFEEEMPYSGPHFDQLYTLFEEMEFKKLLQEMREDKLKLFNNTSAEASSVALDEMKATVATGSFDPENIEVQLATNVGEVVAWINIQQKNQELIALNWLIHREEAKPDQIFGIAFATAKSNPIFLALGAKPTLDFLKKNQKRITFKECTEIFDVLGGDFVLSEGRNALRAALDEGGTSFSWKGDISLQSYLFDSDRSKHNVEEIAARRLNLNLVDEEALLGKGKSKKAYYEIDEQELAKFAAARAKATAILSPFMDSLLEQIKCTDLYENIELPISGILARMEHIGVYVEKKVLATISAKFEEEITRLKSKAYELAGHEFNLQSPSQVATVLFDEIGLKVIKKTKTGASTNSAVLEKLKDKHELPAIILEHRSIAKLKNTYVDVLPKLIQAETGRVHSRFHQTVAATGRLSSSDPNLQNIPVRSEMGRWIRSAFCAEEGNVLIALDYSQIELRILAHVSKDPVFIQTFIEKQDVHKRTASEIFDKKLEDVSKSERSAAKTINFGLLYGMGVHKLAGELGITRREAKVYLEKYFSRYEAFLDWKDATMKLAKEEGAVHTIFNRRRLLKELSSHNRIEVARGERLAINTPIQGSAADIIKKAMVRVAHELAQKIPLAQLILQVHDELLIEVPKELATETCALVKHIMESVVDLKVPLVVDTGIGHNWSEIH